MRDDVAERVWDLDKAQRRGKKARKGNNLWAVCIPVLDIIMVKTIRKTRKAAMAAFTPGAPPGHWNTLIANGFRVKKVKTRARTPAQQ